MASRAARSAFCMPCRRALKRDVVKTGQERVDRLSLRDETDLAVDRGVAMRAAAQDLDLAGGRRRKPASMWSSVVLPAPLGPSRPGDPGAEAEADVVDGDHVAVPAGGVRELDGRRERPGTGSAGADRGHAIARGRNRLRRHAGILR